MNSNQRRKYKRIDKQLDLLFDKITEVVNFYDKPQLIHLRARKFNKLFRQHRSMLGKNK